MHSAWAAHCVIHTLSGLHALRHAQCVARTFCRTHAAEVPTRDTEAAARPAPVPPDRHEKKRGRRACTDQSATRIAVDDRRPNAPSS